MGRPEKVQPRDKLAGLSCPRAEDQGPSLLWGHRDLVSKPGIPSVRPHAASLGPLAVVWLRESAFQLLITLPIISCSFKEKIKDWFLSKALWGRNLLYILWTPVQVVHRAQPPQGCSMLTPGLQNCPSCLPGPRQAQKEPG